MDDMSKNDNYIIEGEEEVTFFETLTEVWHHAVTAGDMDAFRELAGLICEHPKAYNMLILLLTHAGGEQKAREIKLESYKDVLTAHNLFEEATELTFDKATEIIDTAYQTENNSDLK
jgi:hypothetical protein